MLERDDRREKSQQAIYSTLHNLEHKLLKFTQNSKKVRGGLKEILGQSTLQSERKQNTSRDQLSPRFKQCTSRGNSPTKRSNQLKSGSSGNESLITIDEF